MKRHPNSFSGSLQKICALFSGFDPPEGGLECSNALAHPQGQGEPCRLGVVRGGQRRECIHCPWGKREGDSCHEATIWGSGLLFVRGPVKAWLEKPQKKKNRADVGHHEVCGSILFGLLSKRLRTPFNASTQILISRNRRRLPKFESIIEKGGGGGLFLVFGFASFKHLKSGLYFCSAALV